MSGFWKRLFGTEKKFDFDNEFKKAGVALPVAEIPKIVAIVEEAKWPDPAPAPAPALDALRADILADKNEDKITPAAKPKRQRKPRSKR